MLGLGSIVGTGVFVSLGLGAAVAGPWVWLAVLLAGALAACNGLSSAQLAAAHPVAGGTYEYGYRFLTPTLGAVAGFNFLIAKSASAATAALGLTGYGLQLLAPGLTHLTIPLAVLVVVLVTLLVLAGIRRSNAVNAVLVAATLAALLLFVLVAAPAVEPANLALRDFAPLSFLHAAALLFVAYTGYGRVATLGEEITDPKRNIPRAVILTLAVTAALYLLVTLAAVGSAGAPRFAGATLEGAAPLEIIARDVLQQPAAAIAITIGAAAAMLGVLLNLVLGLSRVALAMGRRRDLPAWFAKVDASGTTPVPAVLLVAVVVGALACFGSVWATWSLAAVTVLIYYGLTNVAALFLPPEHRLYPRVFAYAGLIGCFGLCVFVEPIYLIAGLVLAAAAAAWHSLARLFTDA